MRLIDALSKARGGRASSALIVNIRTKTDVKMRVNSEFPSGVEKLATKQGKVGVGYESVVNKQLEREGSESDFNAQPLWKGKGQHIDDYLVEHSDTKQKYLKFLPSDNQEKDVVYRDKATGKFVSYESIKPYLIRSNTPQNQGTEKPIFWNTIKVENVIGLKYGEYYDLEK